MPAWSQVVVAGEVQNPSVADGHPGRTRWFQAFEAAQSSLGPEAGENFIEARVEVAQGVCSQ